MRAGPKKAARPDADRQKRFLNLRSRDLRKIPATSELLAWLQVLAYALGAQPDELRQRLSDPRQLKNLPYLGVLLKDHQDVAELT